MPNFNEMQHEIASMLTLTDDELTDEQRAAMDAYLDELGKMEADKVDAFGQFLRLESGKAEVLKAESQRLAAKAKSSENRIASIKAHYLHIMQQHGLTKVEGGAYCIKVRESESVAVTALVDTLPDVYKRVKTTVEPDKVAIKEGLKGGVEIEGCSLQKSYSLQVG